MSSGDILCAWLPGQNDYPAANAASLSRDVDYGYYLEFDSAADEAAIFQGIMPGAYANGGVTVELVYLMAGANTTDDVVIGAAFQRLKDGDDRSGAVSWAENTSTVTVPDAAEEVDEKTITFTNGADMENIAAGDAFRLRIRRLGSNGSDTAAGDLRLLAVLLRES